MEEDGETPKNMAEVLQILEVSREEFVSGEEEELLVDKVQFTSFKACSVFSFCCAFLSRHQTFIPSNFYDFVYSE